jgi:hypothetical protein
MGFIANQLYAWRPEFPFGRGLLTPASTHRLCSSGGGEPPGSCNAAIEIGIGGAILGVGASVELAFRSEIIGLLGVAGNSAARVTDSVGEKTGWEPESLRLRGN